MSRDNLPASFTGFPKYDFKLKKKSLLVINNYFALNLNKTMAKQKKK